MGAASSIAEAIAGFFNWLRGERDPAEIRKRKYHAALDAYQKAQTKRIALEQRIKDETDPKKKKMYEDGLAVTLRAIVRLRAEIVFYGGS
jgi:hypothetical protein